LLVQMGLFFVEKGFTTTANQVAFISSCATIFMSLRETWNVRPSQFDEKRLVKYVGFIKA
jgi:hypothetical protein